MDETVLASSTHGPLDCTDCHRTFATGQPIEEETAQELCGRCHADELARQEASVHADPEVATCPDCHSPSGSGHDIPPILSVSSPAFPGNVAETCGGCHADERLMARYGLSTDIHDVYMDSPHGKVLKLVGSDVDGLYPATCSSCHGSHDVMDTDDPTSPVSSTASLASLCATCHPGATENFASTLAVHEEFSSEELSRPAFYGERFFFVLTAGVVGLGILMVSLESVAWLTGRAKGGHNPDDNPGGNPGGHNPGHIPGDNPGHNPGGHHATTVAASPAQAPGTSARGPMPSHGRSPGKRPPLIGAWPCPRRSPASTSTNGCSTS